ncbi:MFS transporter [Alicyclobacillus acidoterrestris]|uniref:MFS transporter n=1 Tax=Alicyclobacillus acidoterrestris TaxID=1450 RepID=UPI003F532550
MKRYRFGFVFALWGMLLYGAIDAMRSATGPMLQAQTHVTYTQLGALFAANSIGYLLGSLPSGFIIHRTGLTRTLLFGSIAMGAILVLVAVPNSFVLLWFAFFVLGFIMGWLEIALNAIIPAVSNSARAESAGFNLLHGCYGIGATLFPTLVIYLATQSGHWSTPFLAVGILTLATALSIARYRFPNIRTQSSTADPSSVSNRRKALTTPLFYAFLLSIMLYVVAEVGTASWLPTYLVNARHMGVSLSSWYLTAFYLLFSIGRLTGPLWVHRLGSYASMLYSSVFSLALFAAALLIPQWPILFILSGLGFAVTFPTIVHLASQAFPLETGRVIGLLLTFAGIGSILVNWLIGVLSTNLSINRAFWLIPISLLLVFLFTVIAMALHRSPVTASQNAASL